MGIIGTIIFIAFIVGFFSFITKLFFAVGYGFVKCIPYVIGAILIILVIAAAFSH